MQASFYQRLTTYRATAATKQPSEAVGIDTLMAHAKLICSAKENTIRFFAGHRDTLTVNYASDVVYDVLDALTYNRPKFYLNDRLRDNFAAEQIEQTMAFINAVYCHIDQLRSRDALSDYDATRCQLNTADPQKMLTALEEFYAKMVEKHKAKLDLHMIEDMQKHFIVTNDRRIFKLGKPYILDLVDKLYDEKDAARLDMSIN